MAFCFGDISRRMSDAVQLTRKTLMIASLLTPAAFTCAASPNANAPTGGVFTYNLEGEPTTIHPLRSGDVYGQIIHSRVCATLVEKNPETYKDIPVLAESYEISKDKKVFTFKLRKNLSFHDGHPLTTEDVKFSFDAIFDPDNDAAPQIPYFQGIEKVEIVDPLTIKFTAKDTYFQNFDVVASGMFIIPKHFYGDKEKNKKANRTIVCSGPYKFESWDQTQKIVLSKFNDYFGYKEASRKGENNFNSIIFRFYKEDYQVIEHAKKGDLDYFDLTSEAYVTKAVGPEFGKTVFKVQAENKVPRSFGYIGFNMRNELFQEKKLRLALSHLFNREEMVKKFLSNMVYLANGPIYVQSEYNPGNKPIEFNPGLAKKLLSEAGWKDSNKDGVLDKMVNGKLRSLEFDLLYVSKDSEKYFTLFQQDLKNAGVKMNIRQLEWNALLKNVDEGKFDTVAMAWSASVDPDPKQIWHSASIGGGGSNHIAYSNPTVDKLIDEARLIPDRKQRIAKLKKVYQIIADDAPYIFMFNRKYSTYGHSARVNKPSDTFQYDIGTAYWWSGKSVQ